LDLNQKKLETGLCRFFFIFDLSYGKPFSCNTADPVTGAEADYFDVVYWILYGCVYRHLSSNR
jgi:hypothetical protein